MKYIVLAIAWVIRLIIMTLIWGLYQLSLLVWHFNTQHIESYKTFYLDIEDGRISYYISLAFLCSSFGVFFATLATEEPLVAMSAFFFCMFLGAIFAIDANHRENANKAKKYFERNPL